jgi:hypothetical protein
MTVMGLWTGNDVALGRNCTAYKFQNVRESWRLTEKVSVTHNENCYMELVN